MSAVRIRGAADAAEVAAVLAVLTAEHGAPAAPTGYDRWREQRLTTLRRARASRGR